MSKTVKKKPDQVVYCGPSIPGGALWRYTIYRGGLPPHVTELAEKCPSIGRLAVPVADLMRVDRAVVTPGTPEHSAFAEILRFIQKGGVKQ